MCHEAAQTGWRDGKEAAGDMMRLCPFGPVQDSRRSRADRDVSQSESVTSATSAADDDDNEGSNEEENPEDSEGQDSERNLCMKRTQTNMYTQMDKHPCVYLPDK